MAKVVLKTPKALAMYVHVFEPWKHPDDGDDVKAKRQITLCFPKDDRRATEALPVTDISALKDAVIEVRNEAFGDEAKSVKGDRLCLRDGDKGENENLHGYWYIRAKSDYKVDVVAEKKGPGGKPIELLDDDDFFSGCYCRGSIAIMSTTKGGKRVYAALNGVQRWGKGERLVGGGTDFDDLDDVEVEDAPTGTAADEDDLLG